MCVLAGNAPHFIRWTEIEKPLLLSQCNGPLAGERRIPFCRAIDEPLLGPPAMGKFVGFPSNEHGPVHSDQQVIGSDSEPA